MLNLDVIDSALAQLDIIKRAIVQMRPNSQQAKVLDKVCNSLETAEKELERLVDQDDGSNLSGTQSL